MLLFQSVFVYSLFAMLLYFVSGNGSFVKIRKEDVQFKHCYSLPLNYWLCILIFAFFSGIRYDVGVDYISYFNGYINALNGLDFVRARGIEEGYYVLVLLCSKLGFHPTIFFGLLAAIQLYFLLLAMRDEEGPTKYMLFTLILGGAYLMWMNGIRQIIAASIFVVAVTKIPHGKWKTYLLLLLLAYTWHHSALILLPMYLLKYDKTIWQNTKINLIILITCIIVGNNPSWIGVMNHIEGLLGLIGYDYYAEELSSFTDIERLSSHLFGPRKIIQLVCNILVIFFYPKVRNSLSNTSRIDLFFKMSYIGVCLLYLFDNTLVVFRRPVEYYTIFLLPMIGYTLYYLKYYNKNIRLYLIMLLASCSFLYMQCYIESKKSSFERQSTLYQTYWCNDNIFQHIIP